MSACRLCGVDVRWVTNVDTGERLPIEVNATEYRGPGRYRETGAPGANTVEPIHPSQEVAGYVDHREKCPYGALNVDGRGDAARKSLRGT
jgi:hypothetical protein